MAGGVGLQVVCVVESMLVFLHQKKQHTFCEFFFFWWAYRAVDQIDQLERESEREREREGERESERERERERERARAREKEREREKESERERERETNKTNGLSRPPQQEDLQKS